MHVLDFSTELQSAEVSFTLLKSDSATDALQAISKFLRTKKSQARGCNQLADFTSEFFLYISVAPFTQ